MHSQHSLNARLLRFRSQPQSEDAAALAEDLIAAQRYADARSVLALAQPQDRDDAGLLLLEARAHLQERDFIRAQAALLRAIKAQPRLQQAYRYLGEVLLKRGDPQRALKTLHRALQLDPRDEEARQMVERAEYLAEAANDSLEALPSPLDAVLDPELPPRGASVRPPAPPAEPPVQAAATKAEGAALQPSAAAQAAVPETRRPQRRREDEPTSRFRQGEPQSAAPAAAPVKTRPPALPSARKANSAPAAGPAVPAASTPVADAMAAAASKSQAGSKPAARPRATEEAPASPPPVRAQSFGKRLSDFATAPRPTRKRDSEARPQPAEEPSQAAIERALKSASPLTATVSDAIGGAPQAATSDGPVDADAVLGIVRKLGLFEEPHAQPAAWADRAELPPRGQRVREALIGLWIVSLVLCGAGYFGWNELVKRRHEAAAGLVQQARALMQHGDHGALVDGERLLRLAREQHPASIAVTEEALLLQAQRVLEDGEHDMAALRSAYARAHAAHVAGPSLPLANLLIATASGDKPQRDQALTEVLAAASGDARTLYLIGRAEQRLGREAARTHLQAAAQAEPKLIPAQLALAESAYDRGERAVALGLLDKALATAPSQLRVRLFRMLVSADDVETAKLRQELNNLAEALRKGGPIDEALAALVRARLARRDGEIRAAAQAVETAAKSGVDVERVLLWVAQEALVLKDFGLAQQLASRALGLAPEEARTRRLLGKILVARGAGAQAFAVLSELPADDVEMQKLRAQAALLAQAPELLRSALAGLPAPSKDAPADTLLSALRLRIETRLEPSKAVLDRARALARAAATEPDAWLAVAEAALALREAKTAEAALKQRAALVPPDIESQILLGRSLRMAGDADGAEAAFRRAVELSPQHAEAQSALAGLLLDRGKYAEADAVYRELARHDETALAGRLGRAEAMLGQRQLSDTQVQLEAIAEPQRTAASYREMSAKFLLAQGEVAEANRLLRTLVEEQPKRAALWALQGDALLAAMQLPAASAAYDAALALDSELPEASLGRAELQLRGKKIKDALSTLDQIERALRTRIRPPAFRARRLDLVGQALLQRKRRGDAEAALRAFGDATLLPGAPAEAFFHHAEALNGKDKAAAEQAYRRYLELAPNGPHKARAQRALGSPGAGR